MTLFHKLCIALLINSLSFSFCCSQNVILNSQADVDAFDGSITVITGSLTIQSTGTDPIVDLSNLTNLTTVGENLSINDNDALTNINGLANVTSIGNNLSIYRNYVLININGLAGVTSIGNDLSIQQHYALINIDGLANITSILGKLEIFWNNALTNVDGLRNITSIGDNLAISNNQALTNINGLARITSVGGNLVITNSPFITNIDGLINVISVGGNLWINDNTALTDCCAIYNLLTVPNALEGSTNISNNPSECSSAMEIIEALCQYMDVFINSPCIDYDNGSFQVQITGTIAPFTYVWQRIEDNQTGNGSSPESNFVIENLSEGTYNLTVTDGAGGEFTQENILLIPISGSVFEIIEITSTNSSNGSNNGSIHLTVSGGTPPYNLSWSGISNGSQMNILGSIFTIPLLPQGEYEIFLSDDIGNQQTVIISLLDEVIPIFPCTQPLDILILNDVSGSVDAVEYNESKQFFVDFLNEVNIGTGQDDSRAAIVEWSSTSAQNIQIPITGNLSELQNYVNHNRSFDGFTNPHEALTFGENYLASVARPDVERVLILSTDGSGGQISPSLVSLADQYKAAGYHIVTIAFDDAFEESYTRDILRQVASIDLLAPGAPAYSQLDQNLAENIVNLYLCPIDPGSSATVYFNRDGAINIIEMETNGGCPNPENINITFTIEALRELSIPPGTPVTFYYNDPALFGATQILTWIVPCAILAGTMEIFTVTLPVTGAANIFAVLNDDGEESPPIAFPITDINELAYSNNISDTTICLDPLPTLQVFKYTTTPLPICNNIVIYTVDVCNISDLDATGVIVTDNAPNDFVLLNTVVNDNDCSTENNGSFDIPGGCCVSITYTYDATNASFGNYNDQDVHLSGPINQVYLDFDGASTSQEDVLIDGTVDCPSTVINFTKEVNVSNICEDAFVVYTFTIENQLNIPLQGLFLTDILPEPATWIFQPYNLEGLSISTSTFIEGSATFIINEVNANTVASFSIDAALGDWAADGILDNTATLANVLDLDNGGIQTLTSNTVTTNVSTVPEIEVTQTFNCNDNTVSLSAIINGQTSTDWSWITTGDGTFSEESTASTVYTMGIGDLNNNEAILSVSGNSNCGEVNETVEVFLGTAEPVLVNLESCQGSTINYENTTLSIGDTQNFILQNSNGCDSIVTVTVSELLTSNENLNLETCEGETVDYDGTTLSIGDTETFTFQNTNGCDSIITVTVIGTPTSSEEITLETCQNQTVDYDGLVLSGGDTQVFTFQNSNGCDSIITVSVVNIPVATSSIILETCEGEPVIYQNSSLSVGDERIFTFQNIHGCDSIITVNVISKEFIGNIGLPNIFSPNQDGINDCFGPYFGNNSAFQNFQIQVFDRWGGLVFSSVDPYACWNGEVDNELAENGVYVWYIRMNTDDCEEASVFTGDVVLIR